MASREQSVTLLRRNKAAVVSGLSGNGYAVDENLRMADVARLVRMGAGLHDLAVACLRISDGEQFYLTVAEWTNLGTEDRAKLVRRGLRIRAYGDSFILAPDKLSGQTWGNALSGCAAYKPVTLEGDGIEDPGTWSLPTLRMAQTLYTHRDEINAAMTTVWSGDMNLTDAVHWTSGVSGSNYFFVSISTGQFHTAAASSSYTARPVCILPVN